MPGQSTKDTLSRIFTARHILPVVLLAMSLLLTYKLAGDAQRVADQYLQDEFAFRVKEINQQIYQRIQIYEQVLRGTLGFFIASQDVTRTDFRRYVETLKLQENYPGVEGIGFSVVIPPEDKEQHVRQVRQAGFPDYDINPPGVRDIYTSIIYLEPFEGRNLRAFGYDMFSEETRRAAMSEARDTGAAVMSKKTTLIQETEVDVQAGFLMYLPLYRDQTDIETIEARRKNLIGWVYAPFRMNDLMRGIYGVRSMDFDIEIYDGKSLTKDALMFDSNQAISAASHKGRFKEVDELNFAAHDWSVAVAALPAFEQDSRNDRAGLIMRGGVSISLLLALLVWLFLDDRARAIRAANQAMRLALYDALTGLPNRKLITERLSQAIAKAKRDRTQVGLLFIDLDKFKPVNDEYGHAIGDLLLKEVGRRLQSCMRESDTVARLGGDEFVALLPEVAGKPSLEVAASKILSALTTPFEVAGHRLEIAGSIGVAMYPDHGADQNALMKSADMAMYEAKNSGRSTVRFAS